MGTNLRTCLFSLAALVAVAARADGATGSGRGDPAYHHTHATAEETGGYAAPGRAAADKKDAASSEQAMGARDGGEAGSASGEPRRGSASDWNQKEFLRNVWETP